MFPALVKRAGPLSPLPFQDAQLNEASRCYLYGFFRAAIVLSATALEVHLREAIGRTGMDQVKRHLRGADETLRARGFYRLLVEQADSQDLLGPRERMGEQPLFAQYSIEIFKERNNTAHEGYEPSAKKAGELVDMARRVIDFIEDRVRQREAGDGA